MVDREPTPKYGIPLDHLSDQILDEVLVLYYEVVFGRVDVSMLGEDPMGQAQRAHFHRRTLEDLNKGHYSEWRLGSRLSGQSKLLIKLGRGLGSEILAYFECYGNLDLYDSEERKQQGRQIERDFEESVNNYLLAQNVGKQVSPF
ncbi:MAG: hypothetical protein AAB414_05405 [Patescibacteria group bacterium]